MPRSVVRLAAIAVAMTFLLIAPASGAAARIEPLPYTAVWRMPPGTAGFVEERASIATQTDPVQYGWKRNVTFSFPQRPDSIIPMVSAELSDGANPVWWDPSGNRVAVNVYGVADVTPGPGVSHDELAAGSRLWFAGGWQAGRAYHFAVARTGSDAQGRGTWRISFQDARSGGKRTIGSFTALDGNNLSGSVTAGTSAAAPLPFSLPSSCEEISEQRTTFPAPVGYGASGVVLNPQTVDSITHLIGDVGICPNAMTDARRWLVRAAGGEPGRP